MNYSGVLALLCMVSSAAFAADPASGEAVYQKRCAACHNQTNPRIPPRESLERMPAALILRTLDLGAMMTIAYPMRREEREAVAHYLGTAGPPPGPPAAAFCGDRSVALANSSKFAWNG